MKANIVFARDGRWVVAQSLVLDIASQGRTVDAAVRNLHEAMALYADQSHLEAGPLQTPPGNKQTRD